MKKALSIILSVVLFVCSFGAGSAAFAKVGDVKTQFSVYKGGEFVLEPSDISVDPTLSDKYETEVGINDTVSGASILDAAIAAHIKMYGENFSQTAPLSVSSSGWILSAFDDNSGNLSYTVNGVSAYSLDEEIKDGDVIEFMFYQDYFPHMDVYTTFNTRSATVKAGSSLTLTLYAQMYDASYKPYFQPAEGVNITVNKSVYGKTDKDGKITLTFDKTGTYSVSAEGTYYSDGYDNKIFAPWCSVKATNELTLYTEKQIEGGAKYIASSNKSFDVFSSGDFLAVINAGYNVNAFEAGFVSSVKSELDKNSGKLLNSYGYEDIGIYGAVILCLEKLGYNPDSFEGYNITEAFEKIDLATKYNPYNYRVAVMAAKSDAFAKEIIDALIANYYVMGSGVDYWGYSNDNTATFLLTIAPYKDDYKKYVDDAKAVLKNYKKPNGAFADAVYVTDVNANSTALAAGALASVGDMNEAYFYYKYLTKNFQGSIGVFKYLGEENYRATRDSLIALEYFNLGAVANNFEHPEHIEKTTTTKATTSKNGSKVTKCIICSKTTSTKTIYAAKTVKLSSDKYVYSNSAIKPSVTVKDTKGNTVSSYTVKYSNNKNVGTAMATITFTGDYTGSIKKTFVINPKSTTVKKLTAGKKNFTVSWKKQTTQTTGYQIQYSTNKNFKNAKTVSVSKNTTTSKKITKLSSKKKYFVRVRTYKTVNGKKYYSGWTTAKSVKTK